MTSLRMFQCDAFTSELFRGNPGAVVICENDWLSEPTMQSIAGENNLAETAFILERGNEWFIRFFTPKFEIDLCGHVTMCSAHVIYNHLGYTEKTLTLRTHLAGKVSVERHDDRYIMNFPSWMPDEIEYPQSASVITCLGVDIKDILHVGLYRDYLVVLKDERAVQTLRPDFTAMKRLNKFICITAKGDDGDFVSRFFTPSDGIDEDPVTGSAHCMLIPFWAKILKKGTFTARQLSERGGILYCRDLGSRVEIGGEAVTFFEGIIYLPD